MKSVILCADDFGISPGVNAAIIELAEKKCLSATSCMTVFPDWEKSAQNIKPLASQIDVGLHFTLTGEAKPLSSEFKALSPNGTFLNYALFLKYAFTRKLTPAEVMRELKAQFDAFVFHTGFAPAFIDGHHHVQQLPVVNKVVLEFLSTLSQKPYIRNSSILFSQNLKQKIAIHKNLFLGLPGKKWKKNLALNHIQTNQGFTGVYSFKEKNQKGVQKVFKNFANHLTGTHPLWMVHPGKVDAILATRDTLLQPREWEYEVLKSTEFQDHLKSLNIQIKRFAS